MPTRGTTRATWDAANHDLYSALFFTTAGSAFSVVRRFQGETPAEGAGHGQQAWAVLREKFDGCSRAVIRAEYIRITCKWMRPGQDTDDYLYHMDSCRDCLNACDPPEGPTDCNTIISSSKPFPRSTTVSVKPIARGETSALPTSAV